MVNEVILVGRLGKDPEVRYTADGLVVTSFNLATDEKWKDKSGEYAKKTEWHRIVVFGKLAEICGSYLRKGKLVFLQGKLQTRAWEDKDGIKRSTTEIVVSDMKMLDSKKEGEAQATRPPAGRAAAQQSHYADDVPF